MITASPITRQTVGRTFIVAISVLGFIAVTQLGGLIWAFIMRSQLPPVAGEMPADADSGPLTAKVRPNFPPPFVAPLEADFSANPFTPDEPAPGTAGLAAPKPQPLPARAPSLPEPEQAARFKEAIAQGKLLRDRGDMGTALTRFREAAAMDARSPEAIFEIAVTYEKMQLLDRAAEQWRRIYDMGEAAGPYYTAAESRLDQVKAAAMRQAIDELPSTSDAVEGIAAGKALGLLEVTAEDHTDRSVEKRLTLRIPIKARPREKIDVRDLTIQVLFYDVVDKQNLVQTTANVSSRWTTAPADWTGADTETLEVSYELPLGDPRASRKESRKYFGYLVRVYYKADLQGATGEPEKLVQQFPPEPQLQPDAKEN